MNKFVANLWSFVLSKKINIQEFVHLLMEDYYISRGLAKKINIDL